MSACSEERPPSGGLSFGLCSGHYSGLTSQRCPISFDVTQDGRVINILLTLGGALGRGASAVVSIAQPFRIGPDGAWAGTVSSAGIRAQISGQVRDSGRAEGMLRADLASDAPGRALSTGAISWAAERLSDRR